MRKAFWWVVIGVSLVALLWLMGLTPWSYSSGGGLDKAASEISRRILTVDARDQGEWKAAVYALCTPEGQRFWDENLSNGMWNDIALQGVKTKAVKVQSVQVVAKESVEGSEAAIVVVAGTVTYTTPRGKDETQPFQQTMLLERQGGDRWRFVALLGW